MWNRFLEQIERRYNQPQCATVCVIGLFSEMLLVVKEMTVTGRRQTGLLLIEISHPQRYGGQC